MSESLALDVERIRREARQTMAAGPVTSGQGMDTERLISVLNDVVSAEVVGWLRDTRHAVATKDIDHPAVSARLSTHADGEMRHAVKLAERIVELGGRPNFDPATLAQRRQTDYSVPDSAELRVMLEESLEATLIVISAQQEIVQWLGDRDPDSRRLIESVLADEERNADALTSLLAV